MTIYPEFFRNFRGTTTTSPDRTLTNRTIYWSWTNLLGSNRRAAEEVPAPQLLLHPVRRLGQQYRWTRLLLHPVRGVSGSSSGGRADNSN